MEQLKEMCNSALYKPYDLHPDLQSRICKYARNSISHTLFYGPPGAGKWSLAKLFISKHMNISLHSIYRTQKHIYTLKEKDYFFFKSNVHFELDVSNFLKSQQYVFVAILNELSKTLNVVLNRYKIILIRNADHLSLTTQHQLRMMMEEMYRTTRLIFVSSNIDRLDDTLISRMICIRVASPSVIKLSKFLEKNNYIKSSSLNSRYQTIKTNNNNLSLLLLKNLLVKENLVDEISVICNNLWECLLRKSNPIPDLKNLMQHSNLIHVKWDIIINNLFILHIIPRFVNDTDSERIEHLFNLWNSFIYTYAREHRKEYAIEKVIVELSLSLKHRLYKKQTEDWI